MIGGGRVICPLHGHQFNLKTARAANRASACKVYRVKEGDGDDPCLSLNSAATNVNRVEQDQPDGRGRVLWLSTLAFTLLFNVWMMLGVLGIPISRELGLSDSQLEWLIAVAILSGSLLRLNFGIWADLYGGRRVMSLLLLGAAIPTYLFSHATTYGSC